jgi:LCCL domain
MKQLLLTCVLCVLAGPAAAQADRLPPRDAPAGVPPAGLGGPADSGAPPIVIAPESEDQFLRRQLAEALQARLSQMSPEQMRRALAIIEGQHVPLPPAAEEVLHVYRQQAGAIQRDANRKIAVHRRQAIADLKEIQDKLTRAGQLDEAVAVRDLIRSLRPRPVNVQPDPGSLTGFREKRGQPLYFRVTAGVTGSAWGTDVYTDDSSLATAALHSGALRNGQTGIVRVTMLPGRASYRSSTRHGVTSHDWGSYSGSFRVEPVGGDDGVVDDAAAETAEDQEPPPRDAGAPRSTPDSPPDADTPAPLQGTAPER